jgi:hypothetical protein
MPAMVLRAVMADRVDHRLLVLTEVVATAETQVMAEPVVTQERRTLVLQVTAATVVTLDRHEDWVAQPEVVASEEQLVQREH